MSVWVSLDQFGSDKISLGQFRSVWVSLLSVQFGSLIYVMLCQFMFRPPFLVSFCHFWSLCVMSLMCSFFLVISQLNSQYMMITF
jgi:hypothetical protein